MKGSTLRPFHESIVDAINGARLFSQLFVLGELIKETKIPKGHDDIIEAWKNKFGSGFQNDDQGVVESIRAQKRTQTAET